MYCDLWLQYIQVRKLFKGGNYSRAETIPGNTVNGKLPFKGVYFIIVIWADYLESAQVNIKAGLKQRSQVFFSFICQELWLPHKDNGRRNIRPLGSIHSSYVQYLGSQNFSGKYLEHSNFLLYHFLSGIDDIFPHIDNPPIHYKFVLYLQKKADLKRQGNLLRGIYIWSSVVWSPYKVL